MKGELAGNQREQHDDDDGSRARRRRSTSQEHGDRQHASQRHEHERPRAKEVGDLHREQGRGGGKGDAPERQVLDAESLHGHGEPADAKRNARGAHVGLGLRHMIVTRDGEREHDRPERDEADRANSLRPIRPEHLEPEHAEQHGKRQQLERASNRFALSGKARRQRRSEQTGHQDERHRRRWSSQRARDADEEQSGEGHQKHADQPRRLGEPQRTIDEKKPRIPEAPVQRRGVRKLAGGHQRGDRFCCARRGWRRIGLIVHGDVVEQRRVADERGNGEQERKDESRREHPIASRAFTPHEEHYAGQKEIERHEEHSGDVAVDADAQQQAAREQESRV